MVRWLPLLLLTGCMSLSRMNGAKPLEKGQVEVGMALGARMPDDPLFPLPTPQVPVLFRIGLGGDVDVGFRGYVLGSGFDLRYRFLQRGKWHFAVQPGVGVVVFPNLLNPTQVGTAEASMPLIAEVDATRWLSASFGAAVTYRENVSLAPSSTVARFDVYGGLGGRLEARTGLFVWGTSLDVLYAPTRFTGRPGVALSFDAKLRTRSEAERERRKEKRERASGASAPGGAVSADVARVNALWDYGDPALSETRFREAIAEATRAKDTASVLVYRTQLARTHSLREQIEQADTILDGVESRLDEGGPVVKARYLLERGRARRTGGDPEASKPLFQAAFDTASEAGEEFLAIDAAHMLAIVHEGAKGREWHLRALDLARDAKDPEARGWRGSLLNNLGWDQVDAGETEAALATFEECRAFMEEAGKARGERIARYAIVHVLRKLDRVDEALAMVEVLERDCDAAGEPDGFVFEELGELWLAKGDGEQAKAWFAKAAPLLAESYLKSAEPERLERIEALARGE